MKQLKLIKYVLVDILRNRILIGYTLFLFLVSFGLFTFSDDPLKAASSILNIVLIVVPLFSVIFTSSYYYNAYEFTELVLAQPVRRTSLFISQYGGVSIALMFSFAIGCGLPLAIYLGNSTGLLMLAGGLVLTMVMGALSLCAAVYSRDKAKGIGISLLLWFYFVFIYDALVLMFLFAFSNYPLEKSILILSFLNPVDLIRIIILMHMDMAAIMGYTGALFRSFLGSSSGTLLSFCALFIWIIVPFLWGLNKFRSKDI